MKFIKTEIDGVIIAEPEVFSDDRGYFFESYNRQVFEQSMLRPNWYVFLRARFWM